MLGLPYQVYFGFFFSHAEFLWKAVIHDFMSIKRRTFLGAKLDLKSVTTRPLVLNSDSDATLEACTVRTSLAIFAKEGYLPVPSFNHQKKENELKNCGELLLQYISGEKHTELKKYISKHK